VGKHRLEMIDPHERKSLDSKDQVIHWSVMQKKHAEGVVLKGSHESRGDGFFHSNGGEMDHHLPTISPSYTSGNHMQKE
jgi:hypothetical protein